MNRPSSGPGCDDSRLERLLRDDLPGPEKSLAIAHLDGCEACQRRIERLAAGSRWWADARALDEAGDEGRHPWGPADELWLGFLDPPEKEGQLGRLGSYEVREVIGRGGMGVVLKAYDAHLNRTVAIKVMAPHLSGTAAARRRFAREAKAAAAVTHEHVVAIHAVDPAGRLPYLVMQHVAGKSLQHRIDESGPLETCDLLRIGMQAAAGLAAAHAQGLIHRDVKPSNILLEDGVERVKLTDFGLALAADDASLTESGFVAGTPQYMAPEQARGEPVDHRSDLFSLGSVLYAMACGRPPFRATSTVAVLRRVSDEAPRPVRQVNPDVPEWLEAIIARLHARDPLDRFQSAAEVADLLGRWLAHLHSPHDHPKPEWPRAEPAARRASTGRRARAAVVIALAGAAGLGASTGVAHRVVNKIATILRFHAGDATLVVEVDDPGVRVRIDDEEVVLAGAGLQEIRVRPGRHAVRAEKDGRPVHEEILTVHRGDRPLVRIGRGGPPAPEARPASSGSGRPEPETRVSRAVRTLVARLKQVSTRTSAVEKERFALFMVDLESGEVSRVADEPARGLYYCGSPSWSRDGRRLIFDASPGAVFHRTRIQMIAPDAQGDLGAGACPSFSPDGRRIAFLLNPNAEPEEEPGVWTMRADGTDRRRIGGYGRPRWSRDGRWILLCDFSNPGAVSLLDESGESRPIGGLSAYSVPDWVDRETIIAAVKQDPEGDAADTIALFDISRPGEARLKAVLWRRSQGPDVAPSYPVYSPAARRCIFVGAGARGQALYRLDGDRTEPERLEPGPFDLTIQDLAISPDGRYVLFASDRDARPMGDPSPDSRRGHPPTLPAPRMR